MWGLYIHTYRVYMVHMYIQIIRGRYLVSIQVTYHVYLFVLFIESFIEVQPFFISSMMLEQTYFVTTVHRSSEAHQQEELTRRNPTAYETQEYYVSYRLDQQTVLIGMTRYVLLGSHVMRLDQAHGF